MTFRRSVFTHLFVLALAYLLGPASAAFAQPYPNSCAPDCRTSYTYCTTGILTVHTIPWLWFPSTNNCTGASTYENQLPNAVLGTTLPSYPGGLAGSALATCSLNCGAPQECNPTDGTCCTPNGCQLSTCTGTQCDDGCGNLQWGTLNCSCGLSYTTATVVWNTRHPHTEVSDQSTQWCYANPVSSASTSCPNGSPAGVNCSISATSAGCFVTQINQANGCGSFSGPLCNGSNYPGCHTCPIGINPSDCAANCGVNTHWDSSICSCVCNSDGPLADAGPGEYGGGDWWWCPCAAGRAYDGTLHSCRPCVYAYCEDSSGPTCCF